MRLDDEIYIFVTQQTEKLANFLDELELYV